MLLEKKPEEVTGEGETIVGVRFRGEMHWFKV